MARGEYISTGEAAKILSISRSTVSRRFDAGLFRGKVNSITGERLISLDSIMSFIEKHQLPFDTSHVGRCSVVLATQLPELQDMMTRISDVNERLKVEVTTQGTDALIACSKNTPDLLIISDDLADVDASRVVKSLRRRGGPKNMKMLCCLTTSSAEDATSWGSDASLKWHEDVEQGDMNSLICRMLGIGKTDAQSRRPNSYKRRWTRHPVRLPSEVGIYPLSSPEDVNWGTALVQNVSHGGAYLTDMHLSANTFPAEPFRLRLKVDKSPLQKWEAHCQVLRLSSNGSLSAGVQFDEISARDKAQIAALESA